MTALRQKISSLGELCSSCDSPSARVATMAGAVPSTSLGSCIGQAESLGAATSRAATAAPTFAAAPPSSPSGPAVQMAVSKVNKVRPTATARALQMTAPAPTWESVVDGEVSADISRMLAISNMLYAHRAVEAAPVMDEVLSREVQQLERSYLESQWDRLAEDVNREGRLKSEKNVVVKTQMSARERRAKARAGSNLEVAPDTFSIDAAVKGKADVSIKDSPSDCVATFLTEIGKAKLLTKDEEVDLARRLQLSVELKSARERYEVLCVSCVVVRELVVQCLSTVVMLLQALRGAWEGSHP